MVIELVKVVEEVVVLGVVSSDSMGNGRENGEGGE